MVSMENDVELPRFWELYDFLWNRSFSFSIPCQCYWKKWKSDRAVGCLFSMIWKYYSSRRTCKDPTLVTAGRVISTWSISERLPHVVWPSVNNRCQDSGFLISLHFINALRSTHLTTNCSYLYTVLTQESQRAPLKRWFLTFPDCDPWKWSYTYRNRSWSFQDLRPCIHMHHFGI